MDGSGGLRPHGFRTGQNDPVTLEKYPLGDDGAEAFVYIDLEGAESATGIVRAARKVLLDGARALARHETYAWALCGARISGASAGINAQPDQQAAAHETFTKVLADRTALPRLSLRAGRGIPEQGDSAADILLAHGVVAATGIALGGLEGQGVAIEADQPATQQLSDLFQARGAQVELVEPTGFAASTAAALICGSKVGQIDHEVAAGLQHRVLVPAGATPVTAKGYAVLRRKECEVVPAFLSACGPLFLEAELAGQQAGTGSAEELGARVEDHVVTRLGEFLSHPQGSFMAACLAAEEFLGSWVEELPFGRPLG